MTKALSTWALPLAAVVALALVACDEGAPTGLATAQDEVTEFTFTQGLAAPPKPLEFPIAKAEWGASEVIVEGSETGVVSLSCEAGATETLRVEFTVVGNIQNNTQPTGAAFRVASHWTFVDGEWLGTDSVAVSVPNQSGSVSTGFPVDLVVEYQSGTSAALPSTFSVVPEVTLHGGGIGGNTLPNDASDAAAIVKVDFVGCGGDEPENTAPWLRVPRRVVAEANLRADDDHAQSGAFVDFRVRAWDREDGNLTDDVVCKVGDVVVNSGARFPIGATQVDCSVTDDGGLTTEKSFVVHVQDTTAPVFVSFPENDTLTAVNASGVLLDLSRYDFAAEDRGPAGEPGDISGPVTRSCKVTILRGDDSAMELEEGTDHIGIGETATVSCTITDTAEYRAPRAKKAGPNVHTDSFTIFVSLAIAEACQGTDDRFGFGSPLRISGDPSAHKANSAIPHKVCPPLYADDTPATDLAGGLGLTVRWQDGGVGPDGTVYDDPAAGSTAWRYDDKDGHYVFNAKTDRKWKTGVWLTTVKYAGITIAETEFVLR